MSKRTLKVIEQEIIENIKAFNEAYLENVGTTAIGEINTKQDTLENEYAALAEKVCYSSLKEKENPMLEAIKAYGFNVIKHKDTKVIEKTVVDGEEVELSYERREMTIREKQIDLIKFDNYGDKTVSVNSMWKYELQSLNQLFCIRTAQELNVPFKAESYFMDKMARRIEMGETPVSNTAMLEALQNLVDMVIFEGEDKNKYRANSRDITAILMQYTKSGKARLGIAAAKHNHFARIIGKVLYRIATGEQYTLEYKTSKDA